VSLLYSTERPEFLERVASLAGRTAYRVPEGARGTKQDQLPDAHAIAAALGFARRGHLDIGPDVAFCWALQSDCYKERVIERVVGALGAASHSTSEELALAVAAAWDSMIWSRPTKRPARIPQKAWDVALLCAIGVLQNSAWDALAAAERRYTRAA